MSLQKRILLTITSLLSVALVPTVAVLTWTARQSLLAQTEADGIQIAKQLALSAAFVEQVPREVEDAIAEQMIVQAQIASHLVSIADKAGLSPEEINTHFKEIADKTVLDEFWITDSKGHAYLRNLNVDFTFSPDAKKQPQAHTFWALLAGKKNVVIQEARKREIDEQIFKYIGVKGVDKPRIVQVGYKASFLEHLRQQVGLTKLIKQLLASKNISAIWVIDSQLKTIASGVTNDSGLRAELNQTDNTYLQKTLNQKDINTYLDGSFLKVLAPLTNERGQVIGATLVYLSTEPVQAAVNRQLAAAVVVSALVLFIGLLASIVLSHWLTQPVLRLSAAAESLKQGNWDEKVQVERGDELGILAQSFNHMAQQLRASFTALEMINKELEERVEQRTAELVFKAQELESALQNLQQTQSQLIQTEKMSGLGQMVAGIAHEINNPVNFIHGNIEYISNYTQDLLDLIQLYQQRYPQADPDICSQIETIELDFLVEDLPKIISSMKMGTERISQIVLSLRNFSRLDEADMKLSDIHQGIDSTLLILSHRIKQNIQVIKKYGDLPLVECYPAQLNQVFMNIISNAIDALLEQSESLNNQIIIQTETDKVCERDCQFLTYVIIRIYNNGPAIPQEIQKKLFDPFFTTKPVGKGTGLGLSICYQIIEKHSGKIEINSSLKTGTEFVITLQTAKPITHTKSSSINSFLPTG